MQHFYQFAIKTIQKLVLETNRFLPLSYLYKTAYYICIRFIAYYLGLKKEIAAVYIIHGLATKKWVPGASDIDIAIIVKQGSAEDYFYYVVKLRKELDISKIIFPFLQHFYIIEERYLCRLVKQGLLHSAPNQSIEDWILLCGKDFRKEIADVKKEGSCYIYPGWLYAMLTNFMTMNRLRNVYIRPYFMLVERIIDSVYFLKNREFATLKQEIYALDKMFNNFHFSGTFISGIEKFKDGNVWQRDWKDFVIHAYCDLLILLDRALSDSVSGYVSPEASVKGVVFCTQDGMVDTSTQAGLDCLIEELPHRCIESIFLTRYSYFRDNFILYILVRNDISFEEMKKIFDTLSQYAAFTGGRRIMPEVTSINILNWQTCFPVYMKHVFDWTWCFEYFSIKNEKLLLFGNDISKELICPNEMNLVERFACDNSEIFYLYGR